MKIEDVIDFYNSLENLDVKIWIDGGWSVDALLGGQTREHKDLDIAIEWKNVPKLIEFFSKEGYIKIEENDKWNFVYGDNNGRKVDVHAFIYDKEGNIVEGIMYPAASLTGTGFLKNQPVRCISPEYMIKFLAKWAHKHPYKYLDAISALCKKFNIEYPEEYKRMISNNK